MTGFSFGEREEGISFFASVTFYELWNRSVRRRSFTNVLARMISEVFADLYILGEISLLEMYSATILLLNYIKFHTEMFV